MMRDRLWTRRKRPGEKWPRFSVEVPPELAEMLDAAQRKSLGVNQDSATRPNLVRSGLRLYLNTVEPEPEAAIEGTATEIIDVPLLGPGD